MQQQRTWIVLLKSGAELDELPTLGWTEDRPRRQVVSASLCDAHATELFFERHDDVLGYLHADVWGVAGEPPDGEGWIRVVGSHDPAWVRPYYAEQFGMTNQPPVIVRADHWRRVAGKSWPNDAWVDVWAPRVGLGGPWLVVGEAERCTWSGDDARAYAGEYCAPADVVATIRRVCATIEALEPRCVAMAPDVIATLPAADAELRFDEAGGER